MIQTGKAMRQKTESQKQKKELSSMRKYCEAILRVIELFLRGSVYFKYMTEQKSENSLKSVRKITQEY